MQEGNPWIQAVLFRSENLTFLLSCLCSCFRDFIDSFSLFHPRKINVRSHSGTQAIVVAGQTNLHAEYLFDSISDGLHIARSKFRLPADLFDNTVEIRVRKRIHADADVLA